MASPLVQWVRLVRYVSTKDGQTRYGEPIVEDSDDIDYLAATGALRVRVLQGTSAIAAVRSGDEDQVERLLGPLTPAEVPIVRCVGLNYKSHSESNFLRNIHSPEIAPLRHTEAGVGVGDDYQTWTLTMRLRM
jgi:hypothetical protein